jgi:hypothetical protein
MMKRLVLSLVAGLAALLPLANAANARADERFYRSRYESYRPYYRHEVLYRSDATCAWQSYGTYSHFADAEQAAHHLRHRGYEVIIRR